MTQMQEENKQAEPCGPACFVIRQRESIPNAATPVRSLSVPISGGLGVTYANTGSNNIVVVHANNVQLSFNILFHKANNLQFDNLTLLTIDSL